MNHNNSFWSKLQVFVRRHPVFSNFVAIVVALVALVWLLGVVFLGVWTNHGDTVTVPQVKGLQLDVARDALLRGGFEVELDSLYDMNSRPGVVVEQSPRENSKVKEGRTIYLRYVCFTDKKVALPDYDSRSGRAYKSLLQSLGFSNINVVYVPSANENVKTVRYNGILLRPGDMVPVGAKITVEAGQKSDSSDQDYFVSEEEYIPAEDEDAQFIQGLDFDF